MTKHAAVSPIACTKNKIKINSPPASRAMVLPLHVKDEPPGGLPVPAWRDLGSLACGQPNWSMNLWAKVIERVGQSFGRGVKS